ncbi:copper amine oxidase N-terminal domain-containing protein [Paenibacillus hunanensis]|uniref:copper amine oxidase N-terminal domain-containing protein n=1 Tax=Paenibacillus hunanensis TaxID=539262 RepID=UPI002026C65C|nr:copper amine oxidase N-terminal domain-containing protein [Paenibacillus hunanensis]MCL9662267.1 copper amine oxidase N-terminal domain-containing protein [Paenibacillus hunanensis]
MKMKKIIAPVLSLSLMVPAAGAFAADMNSTTMAAPTVSTKAADLRAGLDYLLSEHFKLAVEAMTKAYSGAPDAAEAYKALDQNAVDMGPAIESIYGKQAATEFERIFRAHNQYTDELVKATKMNNQAAVKQAEAKVQGFVDEFAAFLAKATDNKLPEAAAEKALRLHEDEVQDVFEKYIAGDYAGAAKEYREGLNTMFTVSKALSGAIVAQNPSKFDNGTVDTPAADLRSALNHLAAEHFALSVMQMQQQYDGKTQASDAWINAEAGNTADFKAAIASIYGQAGANQFEQIWVTNHIKAQSDYVDALKKGDQAALTAVKNRIEQFTKEFATFLGTATANNLPASAAEQALMTHEGQVQAVINDYAAKNYAAAYTADREGYKTMFGIGEALGGAIVKQYPDKFKMASAPTTQPSTPAKQPTTSTPSSSKPMNENMMMVWMKLNSKTLKIDGKTTMMDTMPMVVGNTTYIPLRYLGEGIGAKVAWNKASNEVTVMAGSDTMKFWIGKDTVVVNGKNMKLSAKAMINKDGRTVVPLRSITELLGWDVKWNTADGSITLTKSM